MSFAYDSMSGVRPRELDAIGRDQLVDLLSFFNEKLVTYNDSYLDVNKIWKDITVGEGRLSEEFLVCADLDGFGRAREHLGRFSDFMDILRRLMTSLEEKLASAGAWIDMIGRQSGLDKLPDDLLYKIMEYAVSDFDEACTWSHACCRFRYLILSSPKIWANCKLTVSLTPTQISALVQRSEGLPLEVEIRSCNVDRYPTRLSSIMQHSAVIGQLCVMPVNDKKVVEWFKAIQLPVLRSLQMAWDEYGDLARELDNSNPDPYETWTVPQLQHLSADFVPLSQLGRWKLGRNLLSLNISLYDETVRTAGDVFTFLASCPLLETLDLALEYKIRQTNIGGVVSLRDLKSLIVNVDPGISPDYLRHILENISAEKLSSVSFTLHAEEEDLDRDYVNHARSGRNLRFRSDSDTPSNIYSKCDILLEFVKGLPALERFNVHFELYGVSKYRPKSYASRGLQIDQGFLVGLPGNLETFVLTTPSRRLTVHCGTSAINDPAASISNVDFWDAGDLTSDSLLKVRDAIVASGTHLRKIEIKWCPLIREEELRGAITDAEIVYIA